MLLEAMSNTLFTVAISLRESRRNLTITQGVLDLIAKKMCDALISEDPHGDFDSELFLSIAGVRT